MVNGQSIQVSGSISLLQGPIEHTPPGSSFQCMSKKNQRNRFSDATIKHQFISSSVLSSILLILLSMPWHFPVHSKTFLIQRCRKKALSNNHVNILLRIFRNYDIIYLWMDGSVSVRVGVCVCMWTLSTVIPQSFLSMGITSSSWLSPFSSEQGYGTC